MARDVDDGEEDEIAGDFLLSRAVMMDEDGGGGLMKMAFMMNDDTPMVLDVVIIVGRGGADPPWGVSQPATAAVVGKAPQGR